MTYLDKEAEASKHSPYGCSDMHYQSAVSQWDAGFRTYRTHLEVYSFGLNNHQTVSLAQPSYFSSITNLSLQTQY
jgi:hypothetical protein